MFKKILLTLVALIVVGVAALAIVIAVQPAQYRVERSADIAAPASVLFPEVNDFHNWDRWSPWAKLDPTMTQTISDPSAGKGAKYTWNGNSDVGEGQMEIIDSVPDKQVRIKLDFIRPFAGSSISEFAFTPDNDRTHVTWTMSGTNDFIGKALSLFMDMDKMIGTDFENGLAKMKALAEKSGQ